LSQKIFSGADNLFLETGASLYGSPHRLEPLPNAGEKLPIGAFVEATSHPNAGNADVFYMKIARVLSLWLEL